MAGPYYVRSTDGDNASDGSSWANAKATLAGAFAVAAAGETIYVSQSHSESTAASVTLTSAGTAAAPVRILCASDSAEPPTALATTAVVQITGTGVNLDFVGYAYCYGIAFKSGNSSNNAFIRFNSTAPWHWCLENCLLQLSTTGSLQYVYVGAVSGSGKGQNLVLLNTPVQFGNVTGTIQLRSKLLWKGASLLGSASTVLFVFGAGLSAPQAVCDGVDLSLLNTGESLVNPSTTDCIGGYVDFRNCKLGSGVSLVSTAPTIPGPTASITNCDSADTNYRYQKSCYQGDIFSESTIVRTNGASDGTTPISRKMVSSANTQLFSPLESDPCMVWNETVGSSVTATVEVVTDGVTLTDAEAWIEAEYLGTAGYPLSLFASDRAANIMATPVNQAASTVDWTTTGLASPVKQKLSVAFTPQEKGPVKVRVMLAKASTTMYFCPKVDLT